MSVWRQKAMDITPELKKEFEDPDLSPYIVSKKRRRYGMQPAYRSMSTLRMMNWCLVKMKQLDRYYGWSAPKKRK
jgi:hypothetical protein